MSDSFKDMTLLIVDDDESIQRSLARLFRQEEYTILSALNSYEAWNVIDSNNVDVIISDFKMPGKSGLQFLEQVKNIHPEISRIMLTAYTNATLLVDAINMGILFRFVDKPWHGPELKKIVRDAMNHTAQQKRIITNYTAQQKEVVQLKMNSVNIHPNGCLSRENVLNKLQEQINESLRYKKFFSIIHLCIDNNKMLEKSLNKEEHLLFQKRVVKLIENELRTTDIFGNYSTDHFLLVLPFTDLSGTQITAERIRHSVSDTIWGNNDIKVTISSSIGQWQKGETQTQLSNRVEQTLYDRLKTSNNFVTISRI